MTTTQASMADRFIERLDHALRIVEEWPERTAIPRSTETRPGRRGGPGL